MAVPPGGEVNPLGIAYLIEFGQRRLRTIGGVALAVWLLSALYVFTLEPRFSATALLILDTSGSEFVRGRANRQPSIDSQVEIMRSINTVERVAKRLRFERVSERLGSASGSEGTASEPAVADSITSRVSLVLSLASGPKTSTTLSTVAKLSEYLATRVRLARQSKGPAPAVAKDSAADENSSVRIPPNEIYELQSKFRIRRRGLTDVVAIEAWADAPEYAAKLANTYAQAYLQEQVAAKLSSFERLESALAERVEELKPKLARPGAPIVLRELYSDYLSRLRGVRQTRSLVLPDLRIAAPALPRNEPSFPSRKLLLLLSAFLALGLAVVVAFLQDQHHLSTLNPDRE